MTDSFAIVGRSFRDLWDDLGLLVLLNLLWILSVALPIAPLFALASAPHLVAWGASLFLALPLPVISAGLCFVTNQITRGIAVGWGTFRAGVRRFWAKGLLVALVNLVVLFLIAANLRFYTLVLQGGWTDFAVAAWGVVALYWLLAQLFWFPMILELQSEKVLVALRYALALVVTTPGFTVIVGLIALFVVAVSLFLAVPAATFLASWFLLLSNHATRSRLARIRRQPYRPGGMR